MDELNNLFSGIVNDGISSESGIMEQDGIAELDKSSDSFPLPKSGAGLPSPKVVAGLPSPKGGIGLPSPKNVDLDDFSAPGRQEVIDEHSRPDLLAGVDKKSIPRHATVAFGAWNESEDDEDDGLGALPLGGSAPSSDPLGLNLSGSDPLGLNAVQEQPAPSPVSSSKSNDLLGLFDDPDIVSSALGDNASASTAAKASSSMAEKASSSMAEKASSSMAEKASSSMPEKASSSDSLKAALNSVEQASVAPMSAVADKPSSLSTRVPSGSGSMNTPMNAIAPEEAEGNADGEELVFEINSIKSKKAAIARPAAASNAEDKQQKAIDKKAKRKKLIMLLIGAFLLIVIGFVAVTMIILNEKKVTDDQLAAIPEQAEVELNWDSIRQDREMVYKRFYEDSVASLRNDPAPDVKQEVQGKALLAVTLGATRFPSTFADEMEILDNSAAGMSEGCESSWCSLGLWAWGMLRDNKELQEKFEGKLDNSHKVMKNVVETAVRYSKWAPSNQNYNESVVSANEILKSISDASLDWPLVVWIKATTLKRIGKFDDALRALRALDEKVKESSPALQILEAEVLLAQDNVKEVVDVISDVSKLEHLDSTDSAQLETLSMFANSSTSQWVEFQPVLEKYLADGGSSPEKLELVLRSCRRLNRFDECRVMFQNEYAKDSNNMALRIAYIKAWLDSIGYDALIRPDVRLTKNTLAGINELIERGMLQDGENEELWRLKALSAYCRDDYDEAEKAIDEVQRGKDMIWFGSILHQLMEFETVAESKKNAVHTTLKKYVNSVSKPEDIVILAIALHYIGELKAAREVLDKAALYYPNETLITNVYFNIATAIKDRELAENIYTALDNRNALMVSHKFEMAKLLENIGDSNNALERMLNLVEETKASPDPQFLAYVGELFMKQNQCVSAIPYFNQSLDIDNTQAATLFNKGYCLFSQKKYDEALVEFNNAATQDENNSQYLLWIGRALAGLNHSSEAQKAFSTIIDDYAALPESERSEIATSYAAQAYFYRAEIRKMQNRRSETKQDYLEAIRLSHKDIHFLGGYSIFLYENELLKDCIETVNKIESMPNVELDAILYFVRGLAKLKLARHRDAIDDLEKALHAGFADREESGIVGIREPVEIYERLGYLYRDTGRKEDARRALKRFLELSTTISPGTRKDIQGEIDKI